MKNYTETELHEMAFVLSKLSLADALKLMKILNEEFGIKIADDVVEKQVYCGPGDGDWDGNDDDYNKLYKVYLLICLLWENHGTVWRCYLSRNNKTCRVD